MLTNQRIRHRLLNALAFLTLLFSGTQVSGQMMLLCNTNQKPGKVVSTRVYQIPGRTPVTFFRGDSQAIASAVYDAKQRKVYYVNANDSRIFAAPFDIRQRPQPSTLVSEAKTYVRDLAIDPANGDLCFSHSTGSGADGAVLRLDQASGNYSIVARVPLAQVGGYWAGDFAFSPDGRLFISSGNHLPSQIYEFTKGTFEKRFEWSRPISGLAFLNASSIIFSDFNESIFQLDDFATPKQLLTVDGARFTDVAVVKSFGAAERPTGPRRNAVVPPSTSSLVAVSGVVGRDVRGVLHGIRGASLEWRNLTTAEAFRGVTNMEGRFGASLPTGVYRVEVSAVGFGQRSFVHRVSGPQVALAYSLTSRDADPPVASQTKHRLSISVANADNHAIQGAKLLLLGEDRTRRVGVSDSKGVCQWEIPSGRYTLSVAKEGFERASRKLVMERDSEQRVSLVPTAPAPPLITPARSQSIRLQVVVVDRNRRPVPNASLQLVNKEARHSGKTDRLGRLRLALAPGAYTMVAEHPAYQESVSKQSLRDDAIRVVRLNPLVKSSADGGGGQDKPAKGNSREAGSKRTAPPKLPVLTIKIEGKEGTQTRVLPKAKVTVIRDNRATNSGWSDQQGNHQVKLPPGAYSIRVEREGYYPATRTVRVISPGTTTSIVLRKIVGPF